MKRAVERKAQVMQWLMILGGVLLAMWVMQAKAMDQNTIAIGIISPKDGSSLVLAGESHEESIRLAFEHLGPLQVGNLQIKLKLIPWNDNGKPEMAAEGAAKLVHEDHAVAILGPVNSGSTKETLQRLRNEQIELPVISAMSTAPELTRSEGRDKNFFRLIFDDADRMGQYATFIKQEKGKAGEQQFLFLYEDNPYGEGLKNSLKDRFYTPNVIALSWLETRRRDCVNPQGNPYAGDFEALRSGQCFTAEFIKLLDDANINNIVLLGEIAGSLALVNGLRLAVSDLKFDYFFVGSGKRLFDEAPVGSLTIGDPVLDYQRASTAELEHNWRKLLGEFEERAKKDRADFMMTAYEAALVLHSALRLTLNGHDELPQPHALRQKLLRVLESETFDSLEPWRSISFSQGDLNQIPTAPIYRITRGVNREDPLNSHPWIHIAVAPYSPWLEAPVEVQLNAHGVESGKLGVYRVEPLSNHEHLIEDRIVKFSAGKAVERFHLFERGLYHFKMLDVPYYPALSETHVDLSNTYLISACAALVGALLAVSRAAATIWTWLIRLPAGVAAGLLLTFCSFYGQQVSGWLPIPSFGSEPVVNAMLTGLLGGLLGPHTMTDLLLAWASRLLPGKSV